MEKLWITLALIVFHSLLTGFPQAYAQEIDYLNCQFSEPVEVTSTDYEFSQMRCNLGSSFQITATNTTSTFLILREFTYADILEIMLLISIFALLIFYILKKLLVPEVQHGRLSEH